MPPRFEPPDEDEIMRQAKRLQRMAGGGILSNKTVITTTLASAFAGLCSVIYMTWFVTAKSLAFEHRLETLTNEVRGISGERWKVKHAAAWAEALQRQNKSLDVPSAYGVIGQVGE